MKFNSLSVMPHRHATSTRETPSNDEEAGLCFYGFRSGKIGFEELGVDEWLIRTVMALYTEVCTVVRTDAGLSESFEVNVGLHHGSVLSPLLFAAVMDVVSSETRSDLPSELLYADDLVLLAPTMEQLGRRVAEWRDRLLDKGLKVNAGKSKVLVGSIGGKM